MDGHFLHLSDLLLNGKTCLCSFPVVCEICFNLYENLEFANSGIDRKMELLKQANNADRMKVTRRLTRKCLPGVEPAEA